MLIIKLIIGAILFSIMLSVLAGLIINDPLKPVAKKDAAVAMTLLSAFMYIVVII